MSAGDRTAWLRAPGPQAAAEKPAPRPLAEEFPYVPEARRGRHRRPGRLSTVLAGLKTAARRTRP